MSTLDSSSEQPEAHDATLVVARSVSLTLGSGSLLIVGTESMNAPPANLTVAVVGYGGQVSDGSVRKLIQDIPGTKTTHSVSLFNVLEAEVTPSSLVIIYAQPATKDDVSVTTAQYPINEKEKPTVEAWVAKLLDLAYGKAQRRKRLKVLINPFGGKGAAETLYEEYAAPIFATARCQVDVQTTTHRGHASEIAEQIDIDAYDAIVCCSGDGLPYEIFNGLGKRPNAREALAKMAVALLPCGSGNGMTWNLCGTGSMSVAALAVVKGIRTPLDLISITQQDTRSISFLSQSFGIVAESDLATDDLRWMGETRFTYGFLVRLMRQTIWPCDLAIKVVMDDKQAIKDHYTAFVNRAEDLDIDSARIESAVQSPGLPELKYGTVTSELPGDWDVVSGEKMGNFYAGNMAIMTKDTNFFPASLPNDGLMDVVTIDGTVGLATSLKMMMEISSGGFFDMPDVKIRKALAYRLVPRQKKGYISIDGEQVPFEAFQAEIHQGLGTVLSKSGRFYEAEGPK